MALETLKDVDDLVEKALSDKTEESVNRVKEIASKSPNYINEEIEYLFNKIEKEELKIKFLVLCLARSISESIEKK